MFDVSVCGISRVYTDLVCERIAEAAKVDHAFREALNAGGPVPCEVYGFEIEVYPPDEKTTIDDIISWETGY